MSTATATVVRDPSFVTPKQRAENALHNLRLTLRQQRGMLSTTGRSVRTPLLAAIVNAEIAQGREAPGAFNERHRNIYENLENGVVAHLQRNEDVETILDTVIRPALRTIAIELPQ